MASKTKYYGLGFFDFGDPLGSEWSARIEVDRWLWMDKQIFGMMTVFGNGVIDGWVVSQIGSFDIAVGEGHGNINYMSATSTFPVQLTVPSSAISYVYAKIIRSTRYSEEVTFTVSTSTITDPNFILLAQVVAGPLSIETIDNTVRTSIRFAAMIRDAIRDHKHRGGEDNPSKIDLASEVKGQLPGYRLDSLDAEKITSGTFDLARLPLINHQDLQNVGMLTHPQLDTFVKTLESSNKELFGEIGSANLLQMIIALKLIYDDPDSGFYNVNGPIDKNFINEFAIIPGITPNSRIDFDNSSAEINLIDHYIQGQAGTLGTSFYVRWENALAWSTAINPIDVDLTNDQVTLLYDPDAYSNVTIIDSFETTTPNFTYKEIVVKDGQYVSEGTGPDDGGAAELSAGSSYIYTFTWSFTEPVSWLEYNEFLLDIALPPVGQGVVDHSGVKLFFMDADATSVEDMFLVPPEGQAYVDHRTPDFTLVGASDTTLNGANGFDSPSVNLTQLDQESFQLDKVKSIVIWTRSSVLFTVDNLRVSKGVTKPEYGTFKLRYSTNAQVTFQRLEYDSDEENGSSIKLRTRAANGTALLNRAEWTRYLEHETDIMLSGTDLEMEITLYADSTRQTSPILNWIRLVVVADAELDGFTINTTEEFSRGDATNITIEDSSLSLTEPISVGSYYYAGIDKIVQFYYNATATPPVHGENSIFAVESPIAPNQVLRSLETGEPVTESQLFTPRSVKRLADKTVVIADTYNDRVLHFDSEGELIEGFGSINYSHTSLTFPISCCVDPRTGILYVVWSRSVDFQGVQVSGFTLIYGATTIPLLVGYDLINNKQPDALGGTDNGQVMQVHLSEQTKASISQWPSTGCKLGVSGSVLPEGIGSSSFYRKLTSTGRIPMFIGNFIYTASGSPEGMPVFSPTYAEHNEWGTYVYTNATVAVKEFAFQDNLFAGDPETVEINAVDFPSVIEVDMTESVGQKVVFSCDFAKFSPFIPGRATRIESDLLLIGGLSKNGETATPTTTFNFRNINGSDDQKTSQKTTLHNMFFDAQLVQNNTCYRGVVRTISTLQSGGAELFQYDSAKGLLVSDVVKEIAEVSGSELVSSTNLIVAESCFVGQSGRIIKVDAEGNIVFSFGEGTYGMINDVEPQIDGSMVVTT